MLSYLLILFIIFAVIQYFRTEINFSGQAATRPELKKNLKEMSDGSQNFSNVQALNDPGAQSTSRTAFSRYKELNEKRDAGIISDAEYEVELSTILPLLNISKDSRK